MSIFRAERTGFRPLTSYIDAQVGVVGRLASQRYEDGFFTGLGVYRAMTRHRPREMWAQANVLDRGTIVLTHGVAAAAQSIVSVPVGIVMGALGCLLAATGFKKEAADTLTKWYAPAYMAMSVVETLANVTAVCLLGAWLGATARRLFAD